MMKWISVGLAALVLAGCVSSPLKRGPHSDMDIIEQLSPNHNERKTGIDMLVLHYTGMETGEAARERLCDPAAEVSSHYVIEEDGTIYQLVAENRRAWHAGAGIWQGDSDVNSHSIGIEIVNGGHDVPLPDGSLPPYPSEQIEAVLALSKDILVRHDIPQTRVVGHSDIAPARKEDPGEHFPWAYLAENGLGIWPDWIEFDPTMVADLSNGDAGEDVLALQKNLADIGYGIDLDGQFDDAMQEVVLAFQRRWHQQVLTGMADPETLVRIQQVADAVRATH